MTTRQLMRLYPLAWRERYEDEFLELTGDGPLGLQQAIDIVSGAIDARLRRGLMRRADDSGTNDSGTRPVAAGRNVMLQVIRGGCHTNGLRMSKRDSLVGAGVLLLVSIVGSVLGVWLRRSGFDEASQFALYITFPMSVVASMPFTFLKGQPWRAQAVMVGGLTVMLCLIWALTRLA